MKPNSVEELLAAANAEAPVVQPSRNDKYIPIIQTLAAEKNFTAVQIHEWFKKQEITVGSQFISAVRRKHLDSLNRDESGEEKDPGPPPIPETPAENLQPVAETPIRIRHVVTSAADA